MRSVGIFLILTVLTVAFSHPLRAELPPIELAAGIAPLFGLDKPLRGTVLEASLGFRDAPLMPRLGGRIAWDLGPSVWLGEAYLALGLGPGLETLAGLSFPYGKARFALTGGRTIDLDTSAPLPFFGLHALLGTLDLKAAWMRAEVRAFFDYRNWRQASPKPSNLTSAIHGSDALAVFSLGFAAGFSVRLSWAPRFANRQPTR